MNIVVRTATVGDVASVSRIAAETFALACPPGTKRDDVRLHVRRELSPARFRGHLADDRFTLYIAECDGACVGYALAYDCGVDGGSGIDGGELRQLYVRPPFHGRGVGRALTAAVMSHARKRRWGRIVLTVSKENPRAVAFYEKEGFLIVGDTRFTVGADVHEDFVMAASISEDGTSRHLTSDEER